MKILKHIFLEVFRMLYLEIKNGLTQNAIPKIR